MNFVGQLCLWDAYAYAYAYAYMPMPTPWPRRRPRPMPMPVPRLRPMLSRRPRPRPRHSPYVYKGLRSQIRKSFGMIWKNQLGISSKIFKRFKLFNQSIESLIDKSIQTIRLTEFKRFWKSIDMICKSFDEIDGGYDLPASCCQENPVWCTCPLHHTERLHHQHLTFHSTPQQEICFCFWLTLGWCCIKNYTFAFPLRSIDEWLDEGIWVWYKYRTTDPPYWVSLDCVLTRNSADIPLSPPTRFTSPAGRDDLVNVVCANCVKVVQQT